MEIKELYEIYKAHPIVTTDSRNCPEGSIFFALKGETFDGNKFAVAAIEKGCAYAVVDDKTIEHPQTILVDNVLDTLQQLARYHREQLDIPFVGITGTNGKTTTKELVATVLSKKYRVHYTQGNFNNHIGVPLTLLSIKPDCEIAVIEMGANHPGEIKTLANIALPTCGLITNVGKAHLLGFGSFEGVKQAKGELEVLEQAKTFFTGDFTKKQALAYAKGVALQVEESIDRLEIQKDSFAYTLRHGLISGVERYFAAVRNNPKEEARFKKQSAKREKLIKRGKTVDWKVVPAVVYDLDDLTDNILKIINNIATKYENDVATFESVDFSEKAVAFIDFLKEKASLVVYKLTKRMAKEKAIKLMDEVGIPDSRIRYNQYPFEFSGGMRQRIVIAIALSANPDILICDEPTTALDVTIQAQILELMNQLQKELGMAIIMITHDLGVVAQMCDEVIVMYAGSICEQGTADEIFYNPRHEYTKGLLRSIPTTNTFGQKLKPITGTPIDLLNMPKGCPFAPRCDAAMKICIKQNAERMLINDDHAAACWMNVKKGIEDGTIEIEDKKDGEVAKDE